MGLYWVDWRCAALPIALSSTEAAAAIVGPCIKHRVAIEPQGGNARVYGGSVPDADGRTIILNLWRLNPILSVDLDDNAVVVQAGYVLRAFTRPLVACFR